MGVKDEDGAGRGKERGKGETVVTGSAMPFALYI